MSKFLKKLKKVLKTILKIVAIIGMIIIVVIALAPLIPLIVTAMQTVIPALVTAVKAVGKFVWGIVQGFIEVFKPIINGLKDLYERWVKPVLNWVNDKVTWLNDKVNQVYSLTMGGITQTYQNLFGFVDSLQTKFNEITDKTIALVGVVDQKAADKLDAFRKDVNRTIDKYSSDLFDKVIRKVNEIAGPILNKVGEISAVLTSKIDYLGSLGDKATKYQEELYAMQAEDTARTQADTVMIRTEEAPTTPAAEEVVTPPPEEPKKIETPYERVMKKFVGFLLWEAEDILSWVEDVADDVAKDIADELWAFNYLIDTVLTVGDVGVVDDPFLAWYIGEKTFGQLLRENWKEILFGRKIVQEQEEIKFYEEYWDNMKELGYTREEIEQGKIETIDLIKRVWQRLYKRQKVK